ncbi:MAG: C39 family peptidase [Clostridia bacterium]|nr:C39 family peptidase [Clostridia bacterium]
MKQRWGCVLAAASLLFATACVSDGPVAVPSVSSSSFVSSVTTVSTTTTTAETSTTTTRTALTTPQKPLVPAVTVGNVPFIDQTEQYPTGCESVSTVMVLQYWGYSVSVDTFIDSYLPCGDLPRKNGDTRFGCDPYKAFPGNPRSTKGYGCFAPVITAAVENILSEEHRVTDLTGTSLESLCNTYINNGIPVILWATAGMQKPYPSTVWQTPEGKIIEWKSPNHCLVLTGYNDTHYFFNDPQKGVNIAYKRAACEHAFRELGSQAVVIDLTPAPTTLPPITTTITIPLPTTESTTDDPAPVITETASTETTEETTTTTVESTETTVTN